MFEVFVTYPFLDAIMDNVVLEIPVSLDMSSRVIFLFSLNDFSAINAFIRSG